MTATMTIDTTFADRRRSGAPLRDDQRGAIMLTGLFMACFLIGALWFIVGIGDTIVFRERMQEAADHGAFSSAVLHAKGMNFISLCNLVMLVGTVIHLVLGIISDIKFAILVACAAAVPCWPLVPAKLALFEAAYRQWDAYFTAMSKAFKAIHTVQKVAAYSYPALGAVEAYQHGVGYGGDKRTGPVRVLAVSSSLIPGGAVRELGSAAGGTAGSLAGAVKKEGLPVEAQPFGSLCKKVVTVGSTSFTNMIGLGQTVSGTSLAGRALSIFTSVVGTIAEARYCNDTSLHFEPFGPGFDSFWGEEGPYIVYRAASNGNTWMQTWGINVSPKLYDTSESRVGFAAKKYATYTKEQKPLGYFAQAEFYFDCDSNWRAAGCNYEDTATFAIKWRARMRRLELPAITSGLVGASLEALLNLQGATQFKDALPEKIGDVLGASALRRTALKGLVDGIVDQLEHEARANAGGAAGTLDPTFGTFGATPYH